MKHTDIKIPYQKTKKNYKLHKKNSFKSIILQIHKQKKPAQWLVHTILKSHKIILSSD